MAQQVQELIDKIKEEGIQQAEKKSEQIQEQGQAKADQAIQNAKNEADRIVSEAQAQTMKLKDSAEVAIRQAARDVLINLRKEIENILHKIISNNVKEALTPQTLADLIGVLVKSFVDKKSEELDVQVVLNQKDLDKLKKGFTNKLKEAIKEPIQLKSADDIQRGFTISFDGGKSYFDFTDEALAELLSGYLNPEIAKLVKTSVES